jgi:hypothetical protein
MTRNSTTSVSLEKEIVMPNSVVDPEADAQRLDFGDQQGRE